MSVVYIVRVRACEKMLVFVKKYKIYINFLILHKLFSVKHFTLQKIYDIINGGKRMKTVILTTFANNIEAHMLQDILKNEGIESVIQGEISNQVLSALQGFGIQVLVFEEDLERAKAILKEAFPNQ